MSRSLESGLWNPVNTSPPPFGYYVLACLVFIFHWVVYLFSPLSSGALLANV